MSRSITEIACAILRATNDGNDLSGQDLWLVQEMCNSGLNEAGEVAFYELAARVERGYVKPWFCGIENLTKDHQGYVYWRGVQVEHYSPMDPVKEADSASRLADACLTVEQRGHVVTGWGSVVDILCPEPARQAVAS